MRFLPIVLLAPSLALADPGFIQLPPGISSDISGLSLGTDPTEIGCFIDGSVTSGSPDGTVHSWQVCWDGSPLATFSVQSDGLGGVDTLLVGGLGIPTFKSYTHRSRTGASGEDYIAGYYFAPVADANLTQVATTVVLGSANVSYAGHIFLVAAAAGVTNGSDLVVTASGTSIDDLGTRTAVDSEVVIGAGASLSQCQINATAASANLYCETTKKWLGQVTYTLSSTAGTTFNFDFNYGLAKYEDFGNRDFTITDLECVGLANSNDTGFDIELLQHQITGWTYHATAFSPGAAALYSMNTDHSTEQNAATNQYVAWKRSSLSDAVDGNGTEGTIIRVTTATNNSISYLDCHLGVSF